MHILFVLPLLVVISALLVRTLERARIPSVVTMIIFGLLVGYPTVSGSLFEHGGHIIGYLGDAGLLSLMFMAGVESDWKLLLKEKREAAVIAVMALLFPFIVAMFVVWLWGFDLKTAFVVAVCLSISAEATRAKVLMELKKLRTRLGAALIGAGIVDDLLGLFLFLIITFLFSVGHYTEDLLIIGSLVSFFIGVFIQKKFGRDNVSMKWTERSLNILIIPFFFISVGLKFDINSLMINPFLLLMIVGVAFLGKFAGAFASKPLLPLSFKQLHLVGWAMNSRGALGLALALIAYNMTLINVHLYSALVLTVLVTTLSFPFVLYRMVEKDESIMEEEE